MSVSPTLFADGVFDATVSAGVARLTLAQNGPDGKPIPSGQLVMPLVQLPGLVNGLVNLLKQVETKVKEQQQAQAAGQNQAAAAPQADAVPTSFRFG